MTPPEALKQEALAVADALSTAAAGKTESLGTAIDRNQREARNIDDILRARFIALRTTLFDRGIYDPVLGRFDSATVQQAETVAIAEQLRSIAQQL